MDGPKKALRKGVGLWERSMQHTPVTGDGQQAKWASESNDDRHGRKAQQKVQQQIIREGPSRFFSSPSHSKVLSIPRNAEICLVTLWRHTGNSMPQNLNRLQGHFTCFNCAWTNGIFITVKHVKVQVLKLERALNSVLNRGCSCQCVVVLSGLCK